MSDSDASTRGPDLPESVRQGVYVVIAAYNEGGAIGHVVRGVRDVYPHVIVVDDGSRDETARVARDAGAVVLKHPFNRGQGAALQTGITFAVGQQAAYVVTFDADGQHCVDDIARLIDPICRGEVEIVMGSRFLGQAINMTWRRWILLKGGVVFTRIVSRAQITDVHNGLRAFSNRAARSVRITLDRMAHASELIDEIQRCGLPYCEVPVTIRYTDYSRSKGQGGWASLRILIHYLFGRLS
jgi:glycosyltransferase involved in cell wall biosynthesis